MLNPEDDISAGAVALPRRNIFADPAPTSTQLGTVTALDLAAYARPLDAD